MLVDQQERIIWTTHSRGIILRPRVSFMRGGRAFINYDVTDLILSRTRSISFDNLSGQQFIIAKTDGLLADVGIYITIFLFRVRMVINRRSETIHFKCETIIKFALWPPELFL